MTKHDNASELVMTIVNLITDYLAAVEESLALFEERFGRRDLVRAWRERAMPQRGKLSEGVEYQLHGVGCTVEYRDHDVNFDFATQHEVGFDAWRVWNYAEQYPERYPDYQEHAVVEAALAKGLSEGTFRRIETKFPGEANSTLLRLSK